MVMFKIQGWRRLEDLHFINKEADILRHSGTSLGPPVWSPYMLPAFIYFLFRKDSIDLC